jgi:prepilin-type N-terminal cleavage/methylation domain-containing protein
MADGCSSAIFCFLSWLVTMRSEKRRAFTLVELMIVVLVLGVLTAIAIPRITGGAFNAGVNACRKNVDIINTQIELYHSRTSTWPLNVGQVTNDPNYFPDGRPMCPFKTPYVLNQDKRVPEHLHLDRTLITKISESILNKD